MSYVRKNNEKIGLKKYDYIIILKKNDLFAYHQNHHFWPNLVNGLEDEIKGESNQVANWNGKF